MKKLAVAVVVLGAVIGLAVADGISINAFLNVKNGSFDLTRSVSGYTLGQGTNTSTYVLINVTSATNHIAVGSDVVTAGYCFARNVGTGTVYMALAGQTTPFACFLTNNPCLIPMASTNLDVWTDVNFSGKLEFWINNR